MDDVVVEVVVSAVDSVASIDCRIDWGSLMVDIAEEVEEHVVDIAVELEE